MPNPNPNLNPNLNPMARPAPKYGSYGERTSETAPQTQAPPPAAGWDREKVFDLLTRDRSGGHWAATSAATAKQLAGQLGTYLQRDLALTAPWGLPFLLEGAGRGLIFERAPRAAGLSLDVLANGGPIGAVRIRAVAQGGAPRPFAPVRCEDDRTLIVDGGDVLLAVQSTGWPLRPPQ